MAISGHSTLYHAPAIYILYCKCISNTRTSDLKMGQNAKVLTDEPKAITEGLDA